MLFLGYICVLLVGLKVSFFILKDFPFLKGPFYYVPIEFSLIIDLIWGMVSSVMTHLK